MSEKQWRVIADRDKGDDPNIDRDYREGDRLVFENWDTGYDDERQVGTLVRIERPVPTEHCLSTAQHSGHEWAAHEGQPGTGYWCPGFDAAEERPVPTTDEPQKPELVTLHLYRDTCVGGLFLSERELDRTLHEHVEALTIRRDRLPVPSLPTREQISSAIGEVLFNASNYPRAAMPHILGRDIGPLRNKVTDAVLALLQKGAER